jgi:peptidoglycan hydrolase CwlO-like protein
MSQARCNDVVARYDARAAWTAASRDLVGLYLATDAGVVFTRIPAKVWAESIAAKLDSNRRPLPTTAAKMHADELPEVVSTASIPVPKPSIAEQKLDALQRQYSRMEQQLLDGAQQGESLQGKLAELQLKYDALQAHMVPLHKRATSAEAQVKLLQAEIRRLSATATQPTQQ